MFWTHHLSWNRHHIWHGWWYLGWVNSWVYSRFLIICHHRFKTIISIKLLLLLLLTQYVFIHFSCIVFLSIIHFIKVIKYISFQGSFFKYFKHLICGFKIKKITILWLCYFLIINVIKSIKMFVINVFNWDPLNDKKSFKFHWMIFPPEGKCFFIVIRC